MGVSLERVQFKFASIIGELCSEPRVLSQFAVWLDLRLAEYKLKGSISLECSNTKPDPTWLKGIKEEDEPYVVSINKVRKLSHREQSPNSRHYSDDVVVDPSGFHEHSLLKHPGSENVQKSHHFAENPSTDISNRLSPVAPIKEEVDGCQPILPVNLYDNNQTSSNRRKRQSSTIIRNSLNRSSSRSDFRSPYASEDDSLSDRFYSSTQNQQTFLNPSSDALFETPSDSITIKDKGMKEEITIGDQIMTAPGSQSESVLLPGGDSQYSYAKGENSEMSLGESSLGSYAGTNEQDWRRKYARSNRAVSETPEQKKNRMRELAKMRQRRCRERQKLRRLVLSGAEYLMPHSQQDSSPHELKLFGNKDSSADDGSDLSTGSSNLHARSHETFSESKDLEQIQDDSCHQVQPLNLNLQQASQHTIHVSQSSA